jgi:hypothetical protein
VWQSVTFWTAAGAVSAFLYFCATILLLIYSRKTLFINQKAVDAAIESANVARLQAEQSRKSWLLENNPLLWFESTNFTVAPDAFIVACVLRNSGRAPAQEVKWYAFVSRQGDPNPFSKSSSDRSIEIVPGTSATITKVMNDPPTKTLIQSVYETEPFFDVEMDVNYQSPLDGRFYRSFVIVRVRKNVVNKEVLASKSGRPIEQTFTTNQRGVP